MKHEVKSQQNHQFIIIYKVLTSLNLIFLM